MTIYMLTKVQRTELWRDFVDKAALMARLALTSTVDLSSRSIARSLQICVLYIYLYGE